MPDLGGSVVRRLLRTLGGRVGPHGQARDAGRSTLHRVTRQVLPPADRPAPPVVVVVGDGSRARLAKLVRRHRPRAAVVELDPDSSPALAHARLTAAGPVDLVVDDTRVTPGQSERFCRLFPHLRRGGTYVVSDPAVPSTPVQREGAAAGDEPLCALVERLVELRRRGGDELRRHRPRIERFLAHAIAEFSMDAGAMVLRNRRRAVPQLGEAETNAFLRHRPDVGEVLLEHPGQAFRARGELVERGTPRGPQHLRRAPRATFDVPTMSLRSYRRAVCVPGQLVQSGRALVSDSYRKHVTRLTNPNAMDLSPWFSVPLTSLEPEAELSGTYFHLDSQFRGHFGHAMTEQLSRLWAVDRAREQHPDLRLLMSGTRYATELHDFERHLWRAAGFGEDRVTIIDRPVRVERLLAATPMFEQPHYVHPDLVRTWGRIAAALADAAPEHEYPSRIFCARSSAHRACLNAPVVERMFAEAGFEVVLPESFSLPEQARMFRDAEAIAGWAGSALFNICLTQTPKRVVMISSESYTAKNEYLMAAAMGHHLDLVWCPSERPMPEERWVRQSFRSPFTFDEERDGAYLRDLLGSLQPL